MRKLMILAAMLCASHVEAQVIPPTAKQQRHPEHSADIRMSGFNGGVITIKTSGSVALVETALEVARKEMNRQALLRQNGDRAAEKKSPIDELLAQHFGTDHETFTLTKGDTALAGAAWAHQRIVGNDFVFEGRYEARTVKGKPEIRMWWTTLYHRKAGGEWKSQGISKPKATILYFPGDVPGSARSMGNHQVDKDGKRVGTEAVLPDFYPTGTAVKLKEKKHPLANPPEGFPKK